MKIGFVIHRYGEEIVGGSERLCYELVRNLSNDIRIEVITTCAKDYVTWRDEYPEGAAEQNGIPVRRFPVEEERDSRFNQLHEKIIQQGSATLEEQLEWMKLQGPYAPGLISYLKENKHQYSLLVFFTYLYYTTFHGIQVAPDKSILIPTAHDEPPIYFSLFDKIFQLPKAIIFLTEEERSFVYKRFDNQQIQNEVIGMGTDLPTYSGEGVIQNQFNEYRPYILYSGRIDESKGCGILFEYFKRYKQDNKSDLRLIMIGQRVMDIPKRQDIIYLGTLSDEEKMAAIRGAEVVVQPSFYESFSINILEAFSLKVPVLVNGKCAVLKGHCIRSNAGLYYNNFNEFEAALKLLLSEENLRRNLAENGYRYVKVNYSWNVVRGKYLKFFNNLQLEIGKC